MDSTVAAAILQEQGHEVVGLTIQVLADYTQKLGPKSCCSLDHIRKAQLAADTLGIPHYIIKLTARFEALVVEYFLREYLAGRTPNPCVKCNQLLKFGALLKEALALGAEYLASGHYANIDRDRNTGAPMLKRAKDRDKDQSYFLFTCGKSQLRRLLFPLGRMTKAEVRAIARRKGLDAAEAPESQEVCFVPPEGYRELLRRRFGGQLRPGPILDKDGHRLGTHAGVPLYTIGQRKGLGVAVGYPLYVTKIDAASNTLTVGPQEELYREYLLAEGVHFSHSLLKASGPYQVTAKIRYRGADMEAEVSPLPGNRACVRFARPQRAVTPGQAVVFYKDDTVFGGGWITPYSV